LSHAALQDADLSPATVPGFPLAKTPTNLTDADLRDAALQSADLTGAALQSADLASADLTDAKGWTTKQLDEAKSLKGATMPNGQKYEDWIKGRGQDEEKSGTS
jgi:uncharacterized protein YjbI with pentapeptide repeats